MKYIDAEKIIAEIEKMREINRKAFEAEHIESGVFHGRTQVINHLWGFITSLQLEVDLEKEIDEHAQNMPHCEFSHESECVEHEEWAKREFRHFYELGLNARKEE